MADEVFDIVGVKTTGVSWRVFELECLEKYFGQYNECRPEDARAIGIAKIKAKYVYWKLHTESTNESLLNHCCGVAKDLSEWEGVKHINDPRGWLNCHAKEKAFEVWKNVGIPCPDWFEFTNMASFLRNCKFSYPMIVRLNNSTSGWFSYLCTSEAQVKEAITKLQARFHYHHDGIDSDGVGRKMIAVQYINTTRPENVNMSFRIIAAGDKVITGYARLGPASDWIAITNRFEKWMEEPFVKYQKLCQEFCEKNEALIVKSVKSLGLNLQGVDVILDQNNNPYFLEVQPGFSVGYPNKISWKPPFYNPSKPDALRNFLLQNLEQLKIEIPMYANIWLDKYNLFNGVFNALKDDLG